MRSYKKNILIATLCITVLLMAVGYAAFNSMLNITGTSNISSNWDIKITNVVEKNIIGGAQTAVNENGDKKIKWENLTANFETNLVSPGDSIEYDITVTNNGTLNATIDKIALSSPDNDMIIFTPSGLTEGEALNAGASKVLTVKVTYKNIEEGQKQPESTIGNLTVTIDCVQEGKEINTPVKTPANVEITGIQPTNIVGAASVAETPTYNKLKANLKTNLINQNDSLEYNITIQNQGDEAAVLTDLVINEQNEVATITSSGAKEGDVLQGSQTAILKVKVEKSPQAPETQVESDVNLNLDYNLETEVTNKTYSVTYNYKENGGTSSNAENTSLEFGQKVNLTYTAEKQDYIFIGWNTDKNATTALQDLSITGKNITLYAIFKNIPKLENPIVEVKNSPTIVTTSSAGTYPWTQTDGIWKSGNKNRGGSTSTLNFEFTLTSTQEISFDWSVSCYDSYHHAYVYYTIYKNGNAMPETGTDTKIYGTSRGTTEESLTYENVTKKLEPATYKISFYYYKGSYSSAGTDTAYVKNFNAGNDGKTLKITYPAGCDNGVICSYNINGTETEVTSNPIEIEINGDTNLIAKTSYKGEEKVIEKTYDLTPPVVNFNTSSNTKEITAIVNASDTLSEITKYEFKKDNEEWIDNGINNTYIFDDLIQNKSYNIQVRVTNSIGLKTTTQKTVYTKNISPTTFNERGDIYKTVTITYPEGCGSTYICSYIKDSGEEVPVNSKTVDIDFNTTGTLVGKITDGKNEISSSYTVNIKLPEPIYSQITNNNSAVVTITYPEGCGNTYICSYIKDNGNEINVTDNSVEVSFGEEGTLLGKVTDGVNTTTNSYDVYFPFEISELKDKTVTTGDGLYLDTTVENRYVYAGSNPTNYITIGEEDSNWRIIAIEPDGSLKLLRTKSIGNYSFSVMNNHWNNSIVQRELNENYYNKLSTEIKDKIQKYNFGVGSVKDGTNVLSQTKEEKESISSSNVGLKNVTDYIKANTNKTKCGSIGLIKQNAGIMPGETNICAQTNWMVPYGGWTINSVAYNNTNIYSTGDSISDQAYSIEMYAVPVIYLKTDIQLAGKGTEEKPFIIAS